MTQNINLKNPFALVDGVLTHVKDITKDMGIICPECGERLILKEGQKTVKHLAHRGDNNCSGESVIHKYTKEYIYNNLNCITLSEHKVMMIDNKFKLANAEELGVKEKYLEHRLSPEYIPDIYLVLEGNYRVAVEICYKNAKDVEHLEEVLPSLPVDLVLEIKVDAEDIININMEKLLQKAYYVYNPQKTQYEAGRDKIDKIVKEDRFLKMCVEARDNRIKSIEYSMSELQNKHNNLTQKYFKLDKEYMDLIRDYNREVTKNTIIKDIEFDGEKAITILEQIPEIIFGYDYWEYTNKIKECIEDGDTYNLDYLDIIKIMDDEYHDRD